jgi:predicted porin
MNTRKLVLCIIVAGIALFGFSTTGLAASWDAGDWKITMGGNINAFLTRTMCDSSDIDPAKGGAGGGTLAGLACLNATDKNGKYDDVSSVQNGLLPASLNFSASTNQGGWDLSANVNVYYGLDSRGTNRDGISGADALQFSTVDARQVFMTFGKPTLGTFKLGRDFGLFAFDAIINDMTLLGLGGAFISADPGHTSLGGLGFGYVYTDRLAQMNYTTPDWGGFQATLGIFNPFDGAGARSADMPGFHGKASYSWKGTVSGTVSATFLSQEVITTAPTPTDEDIQGFDVFAKVSVGNLGLLGYYYDAEGMSSLAIGGLVFSGFGAPADNPGSPTWDPEEVDGYFLQATYTIGKARLGINWGSNEQDKVTKVENEQLTLGVYYNLTPSLTLVTEYASRESELTSSALPGGKGTDESSNINLGAIMFF